MNSLTTGSQETKPNLNRYSLENPQSLIDLATTLQQFIKENKLSTNIQGKDFVNVEGWQFLGGTLGIVPEVFETENLSNYNVITVNKYDKWKKQNFSVEIIHYAYKAKVRLIRLATGQTIGYGEAFCTNIEKSKTDFDEYAVLSMAQTRAVSKAFRNSFGWIVKAAGFESTPHEEIEGIILDDKSKIEPKKQEKQEPKLIIPLASDEQKATLKTLLESPLITEDERKKMLDNLERLSAEKIEKSIQNIKGVINQRAEELNKSFKTEETEVTEIETVIKTENQ